MTAKQPALHDFGLPQSTSTDSNKPAISVDAPTWLWDNRIRYRLLYASPTHVGFYALDQWLASPPELFQQQLIASGKIPAYPLHIQLLDFEQQFDAPSKARVVLRFSVEAFSPNDKRKLGSHEFRLQQTTKTPDAAGAIKGFSHLVQQADEQIRTWVMGLPDQ
jgi:cholesterol transport system auxiliary component